MRSPDDEKLILKLRKELIHYKFLAEEGRKFDKQGWRHFKMYQKAMNRLDEGRKFMEAQNDLIKQQRRKIEDLESRLGESDAR